MVDACRRNDVLLMEAFAYWFHPQNVAVKRVVDEGGIGEPTGSVAAHSSSLPQPGDIRLSKELDGGVLADKGCCCLNTARLMMGSADVVFARGQYLEGDGVDTRLTIELGFPGGASAQLDRGSSWRVMPTDQSYAVLGEDARIWVPAGFAEEDLQTGNHSRRLLPYRRGRGPGVGDQKVDVPGVHQWQLEAEYFTDRVLKSESIQYPAEDGLETLKSSTRSTGASLGEQREIRL